MKFRAELIASGNATAVEVPDEVRTQLGPSARPPIAVCINGHRWRSRLALMRGQCLIGVSAANRSAAGIAQGEVVEVDVVVDEAERTVVAPDDLAKALEGQPLARAAFDRLPFGLKRKHVADIEAAKSAETRQRRIERLIAALTTERP